MRLVAAERCRSPRRSDAHAAGRFAIPALLSKNDAVLSRFLCFNTFLLALAATPATQPTGRYDILIRNGRVLDGSGNPWLAADSGIRGRRIVEMGRLGNATANRITMRQPFTMTCTDGDLVPSVRASRIHGGNAAFARKIRPYVNERAQSISRLRSDR